MVAYNIPVYPSYNEIMADFQRRYAEATTAAKAAVGGAGGVPSEYKELKTLYSPTGAFGESQRQRIEETRQAGLTSAYAGLVRSGMWSGAGAVGAQQTVGREATRALTELEDIRYGKYGEALALAGTAEQTARQTKVQAYQQLSTIIAGMQPPEAAPYLQAGLGYAELTEKAREFDISAAKQEPLTATSAAKQEPYVIERGEDYYGRYKIWYDPRTGKTFGTR